MKIRPQSDTEFDFIRSLLDKNGISYEITKKDNFKVRDEYGPVIDFVLKKSKIFLSNMNNQDRLDIIKTNDNKKPYHEEIDIRDELDLQYADPYEDLDELYTYDHDR